MTSLFERWLEHILPEPTMVAPGVPLLPLTMGHVLILARFTGWEPYYKPFPQAHLGLGVFVCTRSWRHALEQMGHERIRRKLLRVLGSCDQAAARCAWQKYLDASLVVPQVRQTMRHHARSNAPVALPPNAPFLLRLRLFAAETLNLGLEVEDCVLADLVWLWLAKIEEAGGIKICGDEDNDFEAWCKEQDRRAAENSRLQ